jgi:hypothetical protein
MTSKYKFNYDIFYNFYTNPVNIITDISDCVRLNYFNKTNSKTKMPKISSQVLSSPKCSYIKIDGIKVYITETGKQNTFISGTERKNEDTGGLLFSVPKIMNNELYDFHFNFGKRNKNEGYTQINDSKYLNFVPNQVKPNIKSNRTMKNNKNYSTTEYKDLEEIEPNIDTVDIDKDEKIIYFHKTEQILTQEKTGYFNHLHCHFQDNTTIEDINNIICLQKNDKIMGRVLSDEDKLLLTKIMALPFESIGGKLKKKLTQRNRVGLKKRTLRRRVHKKNIKANNIFRN